MYVFDFLLITFTLLLWINIHGKENFYRSLTLYYDGLSLPALWIHFRDIKQVWHFHGLWSSYLAMLVTRKWTDEKSQLLWIQWHFYIPILDFSIRSLQEYCVVYNHLHYFTHNCNPLLLSPLASYISMLVNWLMIDILLIHFYVMTNT